MVPPDFVNRIIDKASRFMVQNAHEIQQKQLGTDTLLRLFGCFGLPMFDAKGYRVPLDHLWRCLEFTVSFNREAGSQANTDGQKDAEELVRRFENFFTEDERIWLAKLPELDSYHVVSASKGSLGISQCILKNVHGDRYLVPSEANRQPGMEEGKSFRLISWGTYVERHLFTCIKLEAVRFHVEINVLPKVCGHILRKVMFRAWAPDGPVDEDFLVLC